MYPTVWLFTIGIFIAGCSASDDRPQTGAARALPPLRVLGDSDDPRAHFIAPRPVGVDEAGSVLVLDHVGLELVRFDSAGSFERVLWKGRSGPLGHLRPGSVVVEGRNRIRIYDSVIQRVVWIDSAGEPLDALDIRATADENDALGLLAVDDAGWLVGLYQKPPAERADGRPDVTEGLVLIDSSGAVVDTLIEYTRPAPFVLIDDGRTSIPIPTFHDPIVTYWTDRQLLVIDQPEPQKRGAAFFNVQIRRGAEVVRQRRIRYQPATFSESLREDLEQSAYQVLQRIPGGPSDSRRRALQGGMRVPRYSPPVGNLAICPDGSILVNVADANAPGTWYVLDGELAIIDRIALPPDVAELACFGRTQLWAVRIDSMTVNFLARYSLDPVNRPRTLSRQ